MKPIRSQGVRSGTVSLGGAVIAAAVVGSIIESAQKATGSVIKVGKATLGDWTNQVLVGQDSGIRRA